MTRLYHSPSSILTARNGDEGCDRAWALRYIAKIRDAEIDWADIESGKVQVLPRDVPVPPGSRVFCTPRQRSASLGKAMHKVGELWYLGERPAWESYPGQVFAAGRAFLPDPGACEMIEVEHAIGDEPTGCDPDDGCAVGRTIEGVLWAGNRDLLVAIAKEEAEAIGLSYGGIVQGDYKSTASISSYAKSREDLERDLQCAIYTYDACERFALRALQSRWLYIETKNIRRARPTDVLITQDQSLETIARYIETAHRVDQITTVEESEQNPRNCDRYGGCPHHVSMGGPCNARRSIGSSLTQLSRKKKENSMTPEQQARFDRIAAAAQNKAPAAAAVVSPPTETATAPAAEAPAPTPKPRKPRAPKAQPTPESVVEAPAEEVVEEDAVPEGPPCGDSLVAGLLALQTELAARQADVDIAVAARDAVLTNMRELLA